MVNLNQGGGKRCCYLSSTHTNSSMLQSLSAICKAIKSSNSFIDGKSNLSEPMLATLVKDLRLHYEVHYGRNTPKPRPITIPSAKLFVDYSINGSLHIMLSSLLEGATVRDLLPIENIFDFPCQAILPILNDIDKKLTSNGLQQAPSIFLNKAPVGQINKLSKIVLEHGGKIVSNEEKATHIVDWNDEIDTNPTFLEENNRVVRVVTNNDEQGSVSMAQVHWTFFPDSYDEFFPTEALGSLNDVTDAQMMFGSNFLKTKYYVCCRFILDCDTFNEWGNEMDYEHSAIEEDETQCGDFTSGSSKRLKSKRKSGVGVGSTVMNKKEAIVPQAVNTNYPINSDKAFFPEILPPSLTPTTAGSNTTVDMTANPPILFQGSAAESKEEQNESSILGKRFLDTAFGKDLSWYSADCVSDVEKQYLGYIIEDSITSSTSSYIAIRNAIVTFYQQNPSQYLTATECRRKVAGDISKIVRIHEFLDAFGIINQSVKSEQRPINNFEVLDDMSKSLKKRALFEKMAIHYPSYSLSQSVSKLPSPTHAWTVEMDDMLLSLISSRKKDWRSIAAEMEKLFSVTLVQCMMRFLEMPLVNQDSSPGKAMVSDPENSTTLVQDISASTLSICKEEIHTKLKQALELIQVLEKNIVYLKSKSSQLRDTETFSSAAETHSAAEFTKDQISAYENMTTYLREEVKEEIKLQMQRLNNCIEMKVNDYINVRLQIVENKLNVFEHVETVLLQEKERLEVEKHDLMMTKMSLGAYPSITPSNIPPSSSFSNLSSVR